MKCWKLSIALIGAIALFATSGTSHAGQLAGARRNAFHFHRHHRRADELPLGQFQRPNAYVDARWHHYYRHCQRLIPSGFVVTTDFAWGFQVPEVQCYITWTPTY